MDRASDALLTKYLVQLVPMLTENEEPQVVGEANWVQLSERYGRGAGEGLLMLTTDRLVFRSNSGVEHVGIPRQCISQSRISRIVIPRFVELHLLATHQAGQSQPFSFYCTKRLARSVHSSVA